MRAIRIVALRKITEIRNSYPSFALRLGRQSRYTARAEHMTGRAQVEIRDIEFRQEKVILLRNFS